VPQSQIPIDLPIATTVTAKNTSSDALSPLKNAPTSSMENFIPPLRKSTFQRLMVLLSLPSQSIDWNSTPDHKFLKFLSKKIPQDDLMLPLPSSFSLKVNRTHIGFP
jgi:hypothetical protein